MVAGSLGGAVRVALLTDAALVGEMLGFSLAAAGFVVNVASRGDRDDDDAIGVDVLVVATSDARRTPVQQLLDAGPSFPARTPVLAVGPDGREHVVDAIVGGASEYVAFSSSLEDFAAKVGSVARGQLQASGVLWPAAASTHAATERAAATPRRRKMDLLTAREREVLAELARGASTKHISAALDITVATLHSHVSSILSKLGVHSRIEAAAVGARRGILEDDEPS